MTTPRLRVGRAPRRPCGARPPGAAMRGSVASSRHGERGSQSLELAVALPLVAVVAVVGLVLVGVTVDVLRVHQIARDAARAAVLEVPFDPAGADIGVRRHGGVVTATARVRVSLPGVPGAGPVLSAAATMPDEPALGVP